MDQDFEQSQAPIGSRFSAIKGFPCACIGLAHNLLRTWTVFCESQRGLKQRIHVRHCHRFESRVSGGLHKNYLASSHLLEYLLFCVVR